MTVATLPASSVAGSFAVDDACVYFTTAAGIYSLSSSAAGVVVAELRRVTRPSARGGRCD